jgi:hypothetical protein
MAARLAQGGTQGRALGRSHGGFPAECDRTERCFNRLKNSRRIATCYDHTASSFTGFLLASINF